MDQYNIIFDGTISDGYRVEQVKRNLAALFKVDANQVDGLFTKTPVCWIIFSMVWVSFGSAKESTGWFAN